VTNRPRLSVIITSAGDDRALERCLFAIVGQRDAAEIIVADGSRTDVASAVAERFPDVRVLQPPARHTVPALRWAAVAVATGDIIACTEARMEPAPDWCAALIDGHLAWPEAPAVGGTVGLDANPSARDVALYLAEYPALIPPAEPAAVPHLTGANVAYKRAALVPHRDVLDAGQWEPILHARFLAAGRQLRLIPANAVVQNGFPAGAALAMRYHYGRQFAADRSSGWPLARRLGYALAAPFVPLILLSRLRQSLGRAPAGLWRWSALPWLLVFLSLWSAGEAVGYVAGRDPVDRLL
jgi:hypothetical protein